MSAATGGGSGGGEGGRRDDDDVAFAHPRVVHVVAYVDADLVQWGIVERDAHDDPGARGPRCLVFFSDDAARRVWDYPADWRTLPPEALTALSWRR